MKKKYVVTKKECQRKIDTLNHVCNYCGRNLIPIKTVSCGETIYMPGCMHGGNWGNVTYGVPKDIYKLAKKLVLDDRQFRMKHEEKELGDFEYAFRIAVKTACDIVMQIEWMKTHKPRYTKKQLEEEFEKNYKKEAK